jgi:hypothetical protein
MERQRKSRQPGLHVRAKAFGVVHVTGRGLDLATLQHV